MLNSIMDMVKSQVGGQLTDKLGLTSEQSNATFSAVESSVQDVVKNNSTGGMAGMLNLFSSNDNDASGNGMMEQLGSSLVGKLMSKVGLDSGMANSVKNMILPVVIKAISDKVGGDEGGLMSMLGGGGASGIKDKVSGLFGG